MDAPPKPRPRFQLHLSTCVAAMLATGLVLLLNTIPHRPPGRAPNFIEEVSESNHGYSSKLSYGWPMTFVWRATYRQSLGTKDNWPPKATISGTALAVNLGIWLALVAAVCLASEYLIRHRACKCQESAP